MKILSFYQQNSLLTKLVKYFGLLYIRFSRDMNKKRLPSNWCRFDGRSAVPLLKRKTYSWQLVAIIIMKH